MIVRWYVDMQKIDYTLKDILGSKNPVADGIFCCVANRTTKDQQSALKLVPASLVPSQIPYNTLLLIMPCLRQSN